MVRYGIRQSHKLLTQNLGYKFLALLITVLLWIFIMGRDDATQSRELDLVVKLPEDYALASMDPNRVKVSLKGNPKILRRYFEQKEALIFTIYNTKNEQLRLEITNEKLQLPFGVRVESIKPRYFDISMQLKTGVQDPIQRNTEKKPGGNNG